MCVVYRLYQISADTVHLQGKAQEICHRRYGSAPLSATDPFLGITEIKEYYEHLKAERGSMEARILEGLQVPGAAAWIIHRAIRDNHEKYKKGSRNKYSCILQLTYRSQAFQPPKASKKGLNSSEAEPSSSKAGPSLTGEIRAQKKLPYDPARDNDSRTDDPES